jgi:hypothetical protein
LLQTLLLVGCQDALLEMIVEMAIEWAAEKSLITVSEDDEVGINWVQVIAYEGKVAWYGTTGDRKLDAALESGPIAYSVYKADQLAAEGMASRDPSKLDEAITKRPKDWNYRDQKAAILAANGDQEGAQDAIAESEALVARRIQEGGSCRGLQQNMLRGREAALQRQLQDSPDDPILLELLMDTQDMLYKVNTNDPESPCK